MSRTQHFYCQCSSQPAYGHTMNLMIHLCSWLTIAWRLSRGGNEQEDWTSFILLWKLVLKWVKVYFCRQRISHDFFLQYQNHKISKLSHENFAVLQLFSPWSSSSLNHQVFRLQAWRINASYHVFPWMHSFSWAEGDNRAKCPALTLSRDFCWDRRKNTHSQLRWISEPPSLTPDYPYISVLPSNPTVTQQDIWIFPLITYKLCNMTAVLQVGISYIVIKYDQFPAGAMAGRGWCSPYSCFLHVANLTYIRSYQ